MPTFLANENVPGEVVLAARQDGHDLAWVTELSPGADDDSVLASALSEGRVLLTFDKDFGEMALRRGVDASCGVILLRPRLTAPDYLARFTLTVLTQQVQWQGHFTVAQEGKLRLIPLPKLSKSKAPRKRKRKK
jgi:predicted nuclease of predicted toxin-antitoxin system